MNILRIIASLDPATGGPPEALIKSSQAMINQGHHIEILTLDAPNEPWLSGVIVPVHAIGPKTMNYSFSLRLVPWILKNRTRFDAIIIHGIWNFSSIGTWLALLGSSIPYFVFTHGMLDPWFKKAYPLKSLAKQVYWSILESWVLFGAKCVFFTSEEECQLARRAFYGPRYNECVVSYGTAVPEGNAANQIIEFQQRFPALGSRKYLIYLGRIHKKKGLNLLVRAFCDVAHKYPDLDLVVAGPDQGNLRPALEAIAKSHSKGNRVHWVGLLRGNVKWGALRGCEAFILPSHQENFGIAVAEAAACSKPVLITNKVNIWREVQEAKAGLVDADTDAGILRLIEGFFDLAPEKQHEMGQAAHRLFLNRFEIGRAASALISSIRSRLPSRPERQS